MDVARLMEEGRRFLRKLPRTGRFLVVGDRDVDGIIAVHLFTRYYSRLSPYSFFLASILPRDYVASLLSEYPRLVPILLDISPHEGVLGALGDRHLFVVDHHPSSLSGPRITTFNPHELGIPHASRYNTGFLVYLLFKDAIDRSGDLWKVAVSSFGDSTFDYLRPYYYGLDRRTIELAAHIIGSVPHSHLGLLFSALEEAQSVDDFVAREDLLAFKKEFEATLVDTLRHIDRYCVHCVNGLKVVLLPNSLARFKSAVATVYSKRHPTEVVAVGAEEGELYNFSLRMQRAGERGVHLGRLASELASRWGTSGGGHAPAAGLRVPKSRLGELVSALESLLEEL